LLELAPIWISLEMDWIGVQVCSSFAEYKCRFLAHVLIPTFKFKN
jgi:hypothetical protein